MTWTAWFAIAVTIGAVIGLARNLPADALLWGAVLAGANMIFHACGWLEGGLTHSLEKFITDIEAMQTIAEAMRPVAASPWLGSM